MIKEFDKPGEIERKFRHDMGRINPYLSLVDTAVSSLLDQSGDSSNTIDRAKFLRKVANQYGHTRLYPEHLDLENLKKFVHLSHIAFINSQGESFCKKVQKMPVMLKEARNIAKGDFLRKTLAIVDASKQGDGNIAETVEESLFVNYIGELQLKVIDYFRLVRNTQFHHSDNKQMDNVSMAFKLIDQDLLKKEYGFALSKPEEIKFEDVLVLSKTWQTTVKRICQKCINLKRDVYDALRSSCKGLDEDRCRNKIIQKLKRDYLQDDVQISTILTDMVS